jgi:hypothetical protein
MAAAVNGIIPAALVMERFAAPGSIPPLNVLEVRRGYIRLVGLEMEEYRIRTSGLNA